MNVGFEFQDMWIVEVNLGIESRASRKCNIQIVCSMLSAEGACKDLQALAQLSKYYTHAFYMSHIPCLSGLIVYQFLEFSIMVFYICFIHQQ